jgi:hypothetical protein
MCDSMCVSLCGFLALSNLSYKACHSAYWHVTSHVCHVTRHVCLDRHALSVKACHSTCLTRLVIVRTKAILKWFIWGWHLCLLTWFVQGAIFVFGGLTITGIVKEQSKRKKKEKEKYKSDQDLTSLDCRRDLSSPALPAAESHELCKATNLYLSLSRSLSLFLSLSLSLSTPYQWLVA